MLDSTSATIKRNEDVRVNNDHFSKSIDDEDCKVNVNLNNDDNDDNKRVDKGSNATVTTTKIPDEFICPITKLIMKHPLLSRYGQTYERDAILTFLTKHKHICPITRQKLHISDLIRHRALEYRIQVWVKCNNKICATSSKPTSYDTSGAAIESKMERNANDDDDDDQNIVLTCKKSSLNNTKQKQKQERPVNTSVTKHQPNTNKGFIRTLLYRTKHRCVSTAAA